MGNEVSHLTPRTRIMLLALALVLLTTVAYCQQVKRTRTATLTAKTMEYDWDSNVFDFAGSCKVTIANGVNALITAPTMTVKLSPKSDSVARLVAKGPVHFEVITQPDAKGLKRKIVASAQEQACYVEDTQTVTLTGGAQADLIPLDAKDQIEAVHFTGQTITANLKTSRLSVDQANLTVKSEMQ